MNYRIGFVFTLLGMFIILTSFLPENLKKTESPAFGSDGHRTFYNINNINGIIYYNGESGQSLNGEGGILYPAGSAAIGFAEGVLWGGYVNDPDPNRVKLRIGGQMYLAGTTPGRIISPGVAQDSQDERVRIYRIRKDWQTLKPDDPLILDEIELIRGMGFSVDSSTIGQEIVDQYQKDWQEWPVDYGAPFYDLNHNGIYEPGLGETPGLAGADQVLWFVTNDLNENVTFYFSGSPSMGLELQVSLWGYDQPDLPLGQATFRRYRLINKSAFQIDSMYIGMFSDPDIGNYVDDYVGCDSILELGYAYNSAETDIQFDPFNLYPPAAGYQLLQGPIVPSAGDKALFDFKQKVGFKNLSLKAFSYIPTRDIGGLPDYRKIGIMNYNSLRGYFESANMANLDPYFHRSGPDKGEITKFPLSGDPVSGTGDIDGEGENPPPGDRRFIMGSGPFSMAPGDTQEVVYAQIGGIGTKWKNYCVEILKTNARYIKEIYPHFPLISQFKIKPHLSASSRDGYISLNWGNNPQFTELLEADNPEGNFSFEGYKVWQLPSEEAADAEAVLLATYDKESAPGNIYGKYLDEDFGYYITIPYAFGTNSGIQRYFIVQRDYFDEDTFIDGKKYTFAVSAYRYSPDPALPFPVIESGLARITVVAHGSNPGYSAEIGAELPVSHLGKSSGTVSAKVIDPGLLTGNHYKVSFDQNANWSVTDLDLNEVKISDQSNQSGNSAYPVIDGLLITVFGPDSNDIGDWNDTVHSDSFRVSGVDWGGRLLNGGLDLGELFLGSTIKREELEPVRLEFQSLESIRANGFISDGAVYRKDLDYSFSGIGKLPIAAYSLSDSLHPRRLNICFSEMYIPDSLNPNLTWDMGCDYESKPGPKGGYEALFIMKSDYDGGQNYNNLHKGVNSDVLYVLWLKIEPSYSALNEGYRFAIGAQLKNTPEDVFTFSAPGEANVPAKFRLYQNYPNPFNNQTTIRYWIENKTKVQLDVYNMLGQKVAALVNRVQEQGEYFVKWSPPKGASGIYFYQIKTDKTVKTKKMVLVH